MSQTGEEINTLHYHQNIHRDEILITEPDLEQMQFQHPSTVVNTILTDRMELSATFSKLQRFELSNVNSNSLAYFKAMFYRLAREAKVSDHQLVFSGLDEISGLAHFMDNDQYEMIDLLDSIQENSKNSLHKQIVEILI